MISNCVSFFKRQSEEKAFRIYTTEMLRGIAKTMGLQIEQRYLDIIEPHQQEETRTADEVISDIKAKIRKGGKK